MSLLPTRVPALSPQCFVLYLSVDPRGAAWEMRFAGVGARRAARQQPFVLDVV